MTNTAVPTDAELLELADVCEIRDVLRNGLVHEAELLDFARAVLARWGAPAPASDSEARTLLFVKNRVNTLVHLPAAERREYAIRIKQDIADLLAKPTAPEVRVPLSDEQIEAARKATFSTDNPFCPVDRKSMLKAARAIERAHGITAKEFT